MSDNNIQEQQKISVTQPLKQGIGEPSGRWGREGGLPVPQALTS